ncbi:hypothetical protein [Rhizobacter sp. OV335]|uniref:hypothetical protein n=1 Tax=Rhizobacter sp. OV335 TaxID=1500264 RepID=UPI00091875AD|nr:hypothetical protein [Rhizobacter sp. OV335]SHN40272.1 hypothetical protein SAMN02787076_06195 [Rhizobacter sp. OV335]
MGNQLIQRLATQSGIAAHFEGRDGYGAYEPVIAAFATLVAEECAQIAESAADGLQDSTFEGVGREIRRQFGAPPASSTRRAMSPESVAAAINAVYDHFHAADRKLRDITRGMSAEELAAAGKPGADLIRQDDWRTVVLKNVRETQKRLDPPGGPCRCAVLCVPAAKKHAGAAPAILEFRIDWLRTASDEDILRAIDASEAPR